MKKRRMGRLSGVAFSVIKEFAEANRSPLFDEMTLTPRSAIYRCKDGTLTVCLCFKGDSNVTGTQTFRGVRVSRQ